MADEGDREQKIEVYESVLANMTDEQLEAVQRRVRDLVEDDLNFNLFMSVMITSQQLYALARYSLQRECEKEGITWEDGVEEMIIKAAKEHSTQPIARTEVLRKVQATVLRFLTEEVDMQMQDERAELMQRNAEAHEQRMATKITIDAEGHALDVERGKAVIFYGDRKQVVSAIAVAVLETGGTMLEFSDKAQRDKATPKNTTYPKVTVGVNRWSGLAKSPSNFGRVLEPYVNRLHERKCDVVVIDNLPLLGVKKVVGRSRVRTADEALRVLRRWSEEAGAAIVAGIPNLGEDQEEFAAEVDKIIGEHNTIIEV